MDSIPQCSLCFKAYSSNANVPLMLRCGCTFCALCLKTMVRPLQYNTAIKCPSCKVTTPYSPNLNLEGQLPTNVYYLGLVMAAELRLLVTPFPNPTLTYKKMEKLQLAPPAVGSSPLCEECGAREAEVHCLQCVGVYCSPCFSTVHGASLVMRKHRSVPVTQRLSAPPTCHTHHGEQLKYWCTTDKVSVCTACLIVGDHKGHDSISVGEKAEMIRTKLHPLINNSMEMLANMNVSLKTVDQQLRELLKVSSTRSRVLASFFHSLHTSLQVRETSLFENLSRATTSYATSLLEARSSLHSSLNQVQSTVCKVQSTLKDDFVVIRCHGDILDQLSGIEVLPQAMKPGDIQSISVSVDKAATLDYISKLGRVSFDDNNGPILMTATGKPWMTSDNDGSSRNKLLLPSPHAPPSRPSSVTGSHHLSSKPQLSLRARSASPRVRVHSSNSGATQGTNLCVSGGWSLTSRMTSGRSPTPRMSGRRSKTPMTTSGRSPTPRVSSAQNSKHNTPIRQLRPLSPVSLKDTVEVTVTHVEGVGEIFVQSKEQSERVQEVMKELNTPQTLSPLPRELVEEGATVAALFSEDKHWYRAIIESVNMATIAVVTVYYVDFGNSEDASLDRLCILPRHLSDIPPLCSRCSFKHIQPLPIKILEGMAPVGWTNKDKTKLEGLIYSQTTVRMEVLEHTPVGLLLVDFHLMTSDQLKSVSQMLVDMKVAVWGSGKWVEPGIPPPIPLAQGDSLEVVIPVAENPWDFYVHPVSMSRELEELTEQIQECVAKCHLLPTPPPYMGMLCCTYYEADGIWHRARVIKFVEDTTVEVHFIDYGNEEKVFTSTLLAINSKLMKPRQQAIHCQLPQVSPLTGVKWSDEVSDYFNDYVGGCVLKLSVVGEGNPLPVELRETRGQRAIISSHLVKKKKAQLRSKTKNKKEAVSPSLLTNGGLQTPLPVQTTPQNTPTPHNYGVPLPALTMPRPLPAVGQVMEAKVVHVASPHLFHVQPVQLDSQLLNELAKIEAPPNPRSLHPNHLYLSHFGDNLWHRVFLDTMAEGDFCNVTFIDFGNQATILTQNLREIPQSVCDHPPLAVMCRLVDVVPVGGAWGEEASMYFYQLLQEKTLTVTVKSHVGEAMMEVSVSLEGTDVTDTLIQAGYATPPDHTHNVCYLPPVLPGTEEFRAAVTVVTEEGVVYGHIRENVMQLKALNSRIQEVCQSCDHQPPERVVGQSCCARYQQESWCRVTVRGVESGGGSVDVFFIDFGNTETLPLSECVNMVVDPHVPAQALPMRVVAMERPTDDLVDKDVTVRYKGPASSSGTDPVHLVELRNRLS